MADLSGVTDNMLPVSSEVFTNNLSAGISAGAATVPLNSTSGYSEDDVVVLTVDPNTADQATFTGKVQGNSIINCVWTEGNVGASHSLGATVTDYDSATHYNMVTKVLRQTHSQEGELLTSAVQAALNISGAVPADWTPLANTPTVTSNNGQKEHILTYTAVNYTDRLQPGTKLRIPRTGTTPTQSMAFVATSSQHASKSSPAGITFTDDFTCEAWVYLDNYTADSQLIVGRRSVSPNTGWYFRVNTVGQLIIGAATAGSFEEWSSYRSVPTGKWTHVAATLDCSGNASAMYIDGVLTLNTQNTNTLSAITQSGDLSIGSYAGTTQFLNGKVANVRVWSAIRTAAQIRDNMNQETPASTTGLVAHFKGNGSWNDSSANLNHLTAAGGAVNNSATHPYSAVEYAIATKVVLSGADTLVTIFSGNGSIPQESLGATSYSSLRAPYGFPASKGKWKLETQLNIGNGSTAATWTNFPGAAILVPIGAWKAGYNGGFMVQTAATPNPGGAYFVMSTSASAKSADALTQTRIFSDKMYQNEQMMSRYDDIEITTATAYFLNTLRDSANVTYVAQWGDAAPVILVAECAYL